jgi:hypothetical protein
VNQKDPTVSSKNAPSVIVNQVSKPLKVSSTNTNVQLNQIPTHANSNIKSSDLQDTVDAVGKGTCSEKNVQKEDDR